MPHYDLGTADGELKPLASFKILSAMLFPDKLNMRERFMTEAQKEAQAGRGRAASMGPQGALKAADRISARGYVAGSLLLHLLQLQQNGEDAVLNAAIPLVSELLPKWQQESGQAARNALGEAHLPKSRQGMLEAWREFATVLHLWAALVHDAQTAEHAPQQALNALAGKSTSLPVFIAYAEEFLRMGCALPMQIRTSGRFALSMKTAWRFTIPDRLKEERRLAALPLPEMQLAKIHDRLSRK